MHNIDTVVLYELTPWIHNVDAVVLYELTPGFLLRWLQVLLIKQSYFSFFLAVAKAHFNCLCSDAPSLEEE